MDDKWKAHFLRLPDGETTNQDDDPKPEEFRSRIETWLSAMFQSEHLSLLLGNGFSIGVASACRAPIVTMAPGAFKSKHADKVRDEATKSADRLGRGTPNIEDYLRTANQLRTGLAILGESALEAAWNEEISSALKALLVDVLKMERGVGDALAALDRGDAAPAGGVPDDFLGPFLLSFASRSSSRERLALFTTNYDRLVEMGCEREGLRILDRFVGSLEPIFRASRLEVDLHYNPPGIRGEPRFLEGVVKFTKLHGSIDWSFERDRVRRVGLPFGAPATHPGVLPAPQDHLVIFPMAGKDVETSSYPYSELFRDFSAAICRPNSVLVTYGYGFGDSHINNAIRDMLTIPSTHLVVVSFDSASDRVPRFVQSAGHAAQVSVLVGRHFGAIANLVRHYLPKPAIDRITSRRAALMKDRWTGPPSSAGTPPGTPPP